MLVSKGLHRQGCKCTLCTPPVVDTLHAADVVRHLTGIAASVRGPLVLGAHDISDWFAAGGRIEQLEAMVKSPTRADAGDLPAPTLREAGIDSRPRSEFLDSIDGATDTAPAKPKGHRCPDLVAMIMNRADEGFVIHTIGSVELYRLRLGGVAVLTGAPGTGKTSLSVGLALGHARDRGPVVYLSLEMDADELAARGIGMQCEASWEDVLCGRVRREFMEDALAVPRLVVLDGDDATLSNLEIAVAEMRAEYPDQPILVVIDYLQILPGDERDVRARVASAAQAVRRLAKRLKVTALAISQPSRAAGKALSAGELLGADSMTAMAESAEIERAAYITLALGSAGPDREDGSRAVDLSIGKGRMGGGDRVMPISFWGATGRMRIAGDARPAAEVRSEREGQRDGAKVHAALLAMCAVAARSSESLTRGQLTTSANVRGQVGVLAIRSGLTSGDLVEVRQKAPRSPNWRIWNRDRAVAAGVSIVEAAGSAEMVGQP